MKTRAEVRLEKLEKQQTHIKYCGVCKSSTRQSGNKEEEKGSCLRCKRNNADYDFFQDYTDSLETPTCYQVKPDNTDNGEQHPDGLGCKKEGVK